MPAGAFTATSISSAIGHIPDHTYDRTPDSPNQSPSDEPYILPEKGAGILARCR